MLGNYGLKNTPFGMGLEETINYWEKWLEEKKIKEKECSDPKFALTIYSGTLRLTRNGEGYCTIAKCFFQKDFLSAIYFIKMLIAHFLTEENKIEDAYNNLFKDWAIERSQEENHTTADILRHLCNPIKDVAIIEDYKFSLEIDPDNRTLNFWQKRKNRSAVKNEHIWEVDVESFPRFIWPFFVVSERPYAFIYSIKHIMAAYLKDEKKVEEQYARLFEGQGFCFIHEMSSNSPTDNILKNLSYISYQKE